MGEHARAEETQAESARASIHEEATEAMASELAASPAKAPAPSQRLESLSANLPTYTRTAALASVPAPYRLPNWPSVMARSVFR